MIVRRVLRCQDSVIQWQQQKRGELYDRTTLDMRQHLQRITITNDALCDQLHEIP